MSGGDETKTPDISAYTLTSQEDALIDAPDLAYQPPVPKSYRPPIALIGAGGIAPAHLDAYRTAGFNVVAICSRTESKAAALRGEFFPDAAVTTDYSTLLDDNSIEVFDITPHPQQRVELIEQALQAGKHVLSQKPFVEDLDVGEKLIAQADACNVKLAVNQNGRWAPHMAYIREAVQNGIIGDLVSCHTAVHWDHSWIAGTPFDAMEDLILFDFAIHWFDFLASLGGDRLRSVFATSATASEQMARPPMLAQALVQLDSGQASLVFDAATRFGSRDSTFVCGTSGSISSSGPDLGNQKLVVTTEQGTATPDLQGNWFNDGFAGTMAELLCAIEDGREPANSAVQNLQSLALTFAALQSARESRPVDIGEARSRLA